MLKIDKNNGELFAETEKLDSSYIRHQIVRKDNGDWIALHF